MSQGIKIPELPGEPLQVLVSEESVTFESDGVNEWMRAEETVYVEDNC